MLEIKNLSIAYGKKGEHVVNDASLSLEDGKIGVLIGPNGAGKSTLIKGILRFLKPFSGDISINGISFKDAKKNDWAKLVSYVPQQIELSSLSLFDNVLLGRMPYFYISPTQDDYKKTEETIRRLGLEALAAKRSDSLSGGEMQKVAIARALNQEPSLMLFDEPTSNLDLANQILLWKEAKRIVEERNISILMISHDVNMALSYADDIFFMKEGRIIGKRTPQEVDASILEETYSMRFDVKELDGRKYALMEER